MKINNEQTVANESRLLHTSIGWYALTREAYDLGPFTSQQDAAEALDRHLQVYRGINQRPAESWSPRLHVHDSTCCTKQNCGRCAEVSGMFLAPVQAG